MTKISVEISVTSGKNLSSILSVLRQPKLEHLEILVINSGTNPVISDLCNKFNAKEIRQKCSLLQSRYLGVTYSTGDFILILDETRIPSLNLIHSLFTLSHDMVAFPEKNVGYGFINRLDRRDKDLVIKNSISFLGETPLIIPRFYSMQLMKQVFPIIKEKLTDNQFRKVVAKDDRIIFHEASRISKETVFISEHPIFHFNDTNPLKEFKKYSRYGSTSRILKGTEYEFMVSLGDKIRRFSPFGDFPLLFLYVLRGTSYVIGYYLYGVNIK